MSSRNAFQKAAPSPKPDIKTRAELDKLKAQRPKPRAQMHLTPTGPIRRAAEDAEYKKSHVRLAKLEASLSAEPLIQDLPKQQGTKQEQ